MLVPYNFQVQPKTLMVKMVDIDLLYKWLFWRHPLHHYKDYIWSISFLLAQLCCQHLNLKQAPLLKTHQMISFFSFLMLWFAFILIKWCLFFSDLLQLQASTISFVWTNFVVTYNTFLELKLLILWHFKSSQSDIVHSPLCQYNRSSLNLPLP